MSQQDEIRSQQSAHWNGAGGAAWVEAQGVMDAMFSGLETALADAVQAEKPGDILEIGCGTGAVSLAAWRATDGKARYTGIDISRPMLARARERAAEAGAKIDFIAADAETHAFEPGRFDMVLSRFGIMFFADPVAAFANLRSACSDGAKLHAYAWRSPADNPFMTLAGRTARPFLPDLPAPNPDAPGQFGFADDTRVRTILDEAGWTGIKIAPVDIACAIPADALDLFLTRLGPVSSRLPEMTEAKRAELLDALRAAFAAHIEDGEIRFTAACWEITARAS
ncbi:class I SAM-dependent methyltransferase [Henriciella aquimarina]|uniref:class I SAM-dependent methyltransferase n=1 Tax=Henriciella aquimarina TaxID=545261 RepID=UPI000A076FC1|nr:class I SAM-dependent methyltransferase [Henriciella aquimarina]